MTHEDRIETAVTKLEAAVEVVADIATDHEDRLRDLEADRNKGKGMLYVIGAFFSVSIVERLVTWSWK